MEGVIRGVAMDTIQFQKRKVMNIRPRRNRKSAAVRNMVQETRLSVDNLVFPLFLEDGQHIKTAIPSLPGIFRFSLDQLLLEIESCVELGIHSFILFPKIKDELKDATGTYGINPDNYYLQAARTIKKQFPQITLMSDVALDPYNIHGHDGIVKDGKILNDETITVLTQMSVLQAEAGFDYLGPSDMMDGRVEAIRQALDENHYTDTGIISYTAKYASAFYGPFRDALDSSPVDLKDIPKDKKTYQMNPSNRKEALLEGELDFAEGADILMVKPALNYLDIISDLKQHFPLPIAAYHVSGECAMLMAACQNGWLDYKTAMPETLNCIHRAGADIILTYFAKDYAKMQRGLSIG